MASLVVVSFAEETEAGEALAAIRSLERGGGIHLNDTAVVRKDPDGSIHVKNEVSSGVETGAVAGGLLGGLLTFFFPPLGAAVGAAGGALVARLMDTGIEGGFVDSVAASLKPGYSALFLLIRDDIPDAVVAALRPFTGTVLQTNLPSGMEESLREALSDRK